MSTQEENNKEQINHNNLENQEEDEQLDEQTSKALKNLKVDDSAFKQDDKGKKGDKKSKQNKKSNKKGQDFLEYAKNNGIEVKLQFGEEVEKKKEEKAPEYNYNTKPNYSQTQKKQYYNKNQYNKNQYHNNNYNNNSYGNNNYNNINKDPSKAFQNKFDHTLQQQIPAYHNPFMMPQMMPMNMNMNMFQHQQPIEDDSEKSVSECLEYYFSEENLNKDYYIRSRMNDDGYIDAYEIVNFNKMKNRGVNVEKIQDIVSNNNESIIEYVVSDGRLYLRNREWESFKDRLAPLEVLQMQRKFMKKPQITNHVNMQNNYFYQMPPMYMQGGFTPSFDMNAGHMYVKPMGYPIMPPQYMTGYMQGDNVNN